MQRAPADRTARTWLYVPGSRPDRFASAAASGTDHVVIDLEDTVAPAEKREVARALLSATLPRSVPVYLRVNGRGTEWFEEDLEIAARLPVTGILMPRADAQGSVLHAARALSGGQRIVPIIETAAGVWNILEIARAAGVERLALGAVDLQLDAGMHDGAAGLVYARARLVLASRVAGIAAPLDAVTLAIEDDAAVASSAMLAWRDGFGGKLCVHPRQVAAIRDTFAPRAEDVEWAEAVVRASQERGACEHDAFLFRGGLIDRPVLERARRIVGEPRSP